MKTHSRARIVVAAVLLALVVFMPVISVLGHFSSHALPRTTVAGIPVAGMNRDEVAKALSDITADKVALIASPSGQTQKVALEELGVRLDQERSVAEVFQASGSITEVASGLFVAVDVSPTVEVDRKQLAAFTVTLNYPEIQAPIEPEVVFDPDSIQFVVTPGTPGQEVDLDRLENDLSGAAMEETERPVEVQFQAASPAVSDSLALAAAATANEWLSVEVSATVSPGETADATPDQIAQWITFEGSEPTLRPTVDSGLVRAWLEQVGAKNTSPGRDSIQNTDQSGAIVKEVDPGKPAVTIANLDDATNQITESLVAGQPVSVTLAYESVEPRVVYLALPNGDQPLRYSASPGEKWIDVDITNATLTAYEGSTPTMVIPAMPGADQTPTIEGTFRTYVKYEAEDMSGRNVDGSPWAYAAVPSVMYFHELWAIHGSYWRDDFGEYQPVTGSHGCVNVAPEPAAILFDWAPVGTVVVTHR